MTRTLENYPELLQRASGKTGDVRDRINEVLTTLQTSLAGRGAPWGNDKLGSQFADGAADDGYLASRRGVTTSARNMATTFDNFSTSQAEAAAMLKAMDLANGDQYR